jgi:5'-nucleotidase
MNNRPLILISNDDGIDSPGLHAAAEALLPIADLIIAAPAEQQTATGRSLRAAPESAFEPRDIDINGQVITAWCLDASPATTVRHALQCLCKDRKPDMVVSGINFGENIGTNVTASGTVGAAIQSAVWDIKSIAVSLEVPQEFHYEHGEVDWSDAILILRKAAEQFIAKDWPEDVHILKIDIPDTADLDTPWHACRQSREPGWWGFVPDASPESTAGTTIGKRGPRPGKNWHEEDDMAILLGRKEVAITPLSVNMTSRIPLTEVGKLFR